MKNSLLIAGSACVVLALSSCSKSSSNPDSEEGNWVKRGQFDGAARTAAVSFVINETAYVGTGYNVNAKDAAGLVEKGFMKDFWKFNIPTDGSGNYYWTQVATFPGVHRSDAVGFNIGNKGFVGTGVSSNKTTLLRDFWEFDGQTWTQRADYPNTARKNAVGFGLNGKGYITTGLDENGAYQKDLAMYDTTTKTWTNNLPTLGGDKRSGAIALVHGNKAYILGGSAGGSVSTDMFEFDGTKWTEKEKVYNAKDDSFDDDYGSAGSSTGIARTFGVGFVIGDYGYVTTGSVGAYNSQTWRYDFALDRWVIRTAYERTARSSGVGFAVKGRGFIGLGESGSSYLDNFDEFLPNETYSSTD
ncbi:Kelch repeat-containing protein [Filimonas effusa]|uniref:Galactose oxidase n=1 Tax=Filimonas effusa TaxID=2508721 RepID=A0A4Q1D0W2_9BACT|nr:galactose oxidase [Filimonas effusa]RXK80864.1 galactose oxidase [Filimonas effusa]